MTDRKIGRGEAQWSGFMIGAWHIMVGAGVFRGVQSISDGEVPWLGMAITVMAAFWISRNAIKIIDYSKQ